MSDLDQPTAVDSWTTSGGSSSVEWDHRAFLWWPAKNLAVLPFNDWYSNFSGAVALNISDGKIVEFASLQDQINLEFEGYENYGDKFTKATS